MGTTRTYTPGASGSNSGKQRTVILFINCNGRDTSQANGQILHEEEPTFLADPGTTEGQATHNVITHNAAYQADDLDAYDSECDSSNTAKMLSSSEFISSWSNAHAEGLLVVGDRMGLSESIAMTHGTHHLLLWLKLHSLSTTSLNARVFLVDSGYAS
ncbi:hypothetical protein Tco_0391024 [Tanacetum coccineum]